MADVVITGAVGAEPLTTLAAWKEASRALRKGDDTQINALYPRVLKTIEWYYNEFNNADREAFVSERGWKDIMTHLATGNSGCVCASSRTHPPSRTGGSTRALSRPVAEQ